MATLNGICNAVFEVILTPFRNLNPAWALLAISLLTGLLMLVVFKKTSNQKGIKEVKNRVKAHLLELRLYKDDMSLSFDAMKGVFRANFKYLLHTLKPMLVLMVPTVLILIQLASRYEYRPLHLGESAILSLTSANGSVLNEIRLELPDGVSSETPPLRILPEKQINWRIKAQKEGEWDIRFHVGEEVLTKKLIVGSGLEPLASRCSGGHFLTQLLNPAEPPLSATSSVSEIRIQYPSRDLAVWGQNVDWLLAFMGLSILMGFATKGFVNVEI